MAMQYQQDGEYATIRRQWEALPSVLGDGERPYVPHRQFPMMLHLAGTFTGGGLGIIQTQIVGRVISDPKTGVPMEGHNDVAAYEAAIERGFRETPLEAIEFYNEQQLEYAKLAAERAYEVRHKLSPKAAAEIAAAEEDAGAVHLPTIPETPIKRRGRKPKAKE